jgi:putative membrane protein
MKNLLLALALAGLTLSAVAAPDKSQGLSEPPLDDASVAAAVKVANDTEIDAGKSAVDKAGSRDVRAFARRMVHDHTANNEQVAAVLGRLGIEPGENEVARSIRHDDAAQEERGVSQDSETLDQAYRARLIRAHRRVLAVLDKALASDQRHDAEFRSLLQKTRDMEARHLEQAESLRPPAPSSPF